MVRTWKYSKLNKLVFIKKNYFYSQKPFFEKLFNTFFIILKLFVRTSSLKFRIFDFIYYIK